MLESLLTRTNMTYAAAAASIWQLALTFRFAAHIRRQAGADPERYTPPVSVIVACKGLPRYFEQNILSLLEQEYDGDCEFVFVSPSRSDPAYCRLKHLLANHPHARTKLLSSDAVPVRCSEKILNLLFALKHASPESAVLAFADCDVWIPRNWLKQLVAPLSRRDTIAVSAPAIYSSDTLNPLQILQTAWMCMIACFLDFFGSIFGWSWAIRRADFEAAGVAKAWETSLTDDFVLNRLLKRTGKHIEWALLAMPVCREKPGITQVLTPFIKGFQYFRVYDKSVWITGGLEAFGKLYLCFWFLKEGQLIIAWLLTAVDAVTVFLVLETIKRHIPDALRFTHPLLRRYPLLVAAVTPVLLVLRLYIFLVSIWTTRVRWGGYIYKMKSAGDIRVTGTG